MNLLHATAIAQSIFDALTLVSFKRLQFSLNGHKNVYMQAL